MAMDGQQNDKKKRHREQQQVASLQVLERISSDQQAPGQKKEKKRKVKENAAEVNGHSILIDGFEGGGPFSADEENKKKKKVMKQQEPEAHSDCSVPERVSLGESVKEFPNCKNVASKKDKKKRSQAEPYEDLGAMNNADFQNGGTHTKEKRKHKSKAMIKEHSSTSPHLIENGKAPFNQNISDEGLGAMNNEDFQNGGTHTKEKRKHKSKAMNEEHNSTSPRVIENGKKPFNQNIRDDHSLQVTVSGPCSDNAKFGPLLSFQNLRVPENVLVCCKAFQRPSPIQAHAWPFLLDGQDLIGIAATGSGKTLAFGLPALVHVLECSKRMSKPKNPLCLVLSPTRELAQQISEVLVGAGHPCGVNTACLYGGSSKKPQLASLKVGAAIVVATPGRLVDIVEEGHCSLQDVSYVVFGVP